MGKSFRSSERQHEGHGVHVHLLHHTLLGVHGHHIAQRGQDQQAGAHGHEATGDIALTGTEGEAEVRHLKERLSSS